MLLLLAAAQGYVSFRAQYSFIDHAKRTHVPSLLEALGLDTGAIIFALLALSSTVLILGGFVVAFPGGCRPVAEPRGSYPNRTSVTTALLTRKTS